MRCYEVLENIKDGRAIASKCATEIIRFRCQNVVIVFSNAGPDMTQLSKDRRRLFHINKDWEATNVAYENVVLKKHDSPSFVTS